MIIANQDRINGWLGLTEKELKDDEYLPTCERVGHDDLIRKLILRLDGLDRRLQRIELDTATIIAILNENN